MSQALINPAMITWARERSNLSIGELNSKINKKFEDWEKGESKPSFLQAQTIAKKLHIPFGYLYLKKPPEEQVLTPDLRTLDDLQNTNYSVDLKEVITDAMRKQDWYHEYLQEIEAEPLDFISKYSINTPFNIVADDITKTLNLPLKERKSCKNWEGFLNYLIVKAEDVGISIMRNGKVGFNTNRMLSPEEFRGFVLTDTLSPIVFLNSADYKVAQIFTLIHEITHLWIGESGVSNYRLDSEAHYLNIEKYCNQIAAEVLVPEQDIRELWDNRITIKDNSDKLVKKYYVSNVVIARRALDLSLVQKEVFFSYYKELKENCIGPNKSSKN